jgi:hypothetical protein
LGLPAVLFPNGFQLVSFLTILSSSILCVCPNHLSLCALIQRTIFTPPVKFSVNFPQHFPFKYQQFLQFTFSCCPCFCCISYNRSY